MDNATTPTAGGIADTRLAPNNRFVTDIDDIGAGPGPQVISADTLEGTEVRNERGDRLGKIRDVMIDIRLGRVAYAVLSRGGIFNIGDKLFAVPWSALAMDGGQDCFILEVNEEDLDRAPGFDKDHWPTMADTRWASSIHSHYSRPPYWE